MSLFDEASLVITPNGVKEGKLYSVKPTDGSGDLNVVRATTATRVNADGFIETVDANVPRLDYTNGSCPSILVEPQRTNYSPKSEQTDTWTYTEFGAGSQGTITTGKTDMFGGTNAVQIDFPSDAENVGILFGTATSGLNSGNCNISIYVKLVESGSKNLQLRAGFKDIVNVSSTEFTRVDLSGTKINAEAFNLKLRPSEGTSNGGFSIIICHPQEENGSYATSYTPTVGSSVTRNADVISKTGISDLIGQTEGTIFVDFIPTERKISRYISLESASGFVNGWIGIFSATASPYKFRFYGDGFDFYSTNEVQLNQRYKIALSYKNGVVTSAYINGISQGTLTANTTSKSYASIEIATAPLGDRGDGKYKQVTLFKTALTNSELAQLTTI